MRSLAVYLILMESSMTNVVLMLCDYNFQGRKMQRMTQKIWNLYKTIKHQVTKLRTVQRISCIQIADKFINESERIQAPRKNKLN